MASEVSTDFVATQLRKEADQSRWVNAYTLLVSSIGVGIVALAIATAPAHWTGVLLFVLLAGLAEWGGAGLFSGSRNSRVSVSSIVALASVLTFGPLAGALTHLGSGIAVALISARQPQSSKSGASWVRRSAFNIGMLVIATAAAGLAYQVVGGVPIVAGAPILPLLLPLVVAAAADQLVNIGILIGIIVLQTGKRPWAIWQQNFQWGVPIAVLGGVLGGGALALAYAMFGIVGVGVFFLPIAATNYSLRLYTNNMKVYVNRLEEANRRLDGVNVGLLETLGSVIDAYDIYTYGHSTQVAIYAEAIAKQMRLSQDEQSQIFKAALVHDVGKIGIMDSIIGKPTRLTDDEFELVKRHPVIGAEIVGRMEGLRELVPLVRHHHERWDGRGYPDRLAGTAIPLGARILTVADTLDAMFSDRPYRPRRNFEEVRDEIARCSGAHFDPHVVEAFLRVAEERDVSFWRNSAVTVDDLVLADGTETTLTEARLLKKSMLAR